MRIINFFYIGSIVGSTTLSANIIPRSVFISQGYDDKIIVQMMTGLTEEINQGWEAKKVLTLPSILQSFQIRPLQGLTPEQIQLPSESSPGLAISWQKKEPVIALMFEVMTQHKSEQTIDILVPAHVASVDWFHQPTDSSLVSSADMEYKGLIQNFGGTYYTLHWVNPSQLDPQPHKLQIKFTQLDRGRGPYWLIGSFVGMVILIGYFSALIMRKSKN